MSVEQTISLLAAIRLAQQTNKRTTRIIIHFFLFRYDTKFEFRILIKTDETNKNGKKYKSCA